MIKKFFKNLFDTLGLSKDMDQIIAKHIDLLNYNERTGETVFMKSTGVDDANVREQKAQENFNFAQQKVLKLQEEIALQEKALKENERKFRDQQHILYNYFDEEKVKLDNAWNNIVVSGNLDEKKLAEIKILMEQYREDIKNVIESIISERNDTVQYVDKLTKTLKKLTLIDINFHSLEAKEDTERKKIKP